MKQYGTIFKLEAIVEIVFFFSFFLVVLNQGLLHARQACTTELHPQPQKLFVLVLIFFEICVR
jgi:hypothetical protein